ncbi:MAG: MBL fold metallo-hydrolase [Solobacterium sp.]|nr:MBL fold metallo-hydrolase [Solobacterium sp.]
MSECTIIRMNADTWRIEDAGVRFFLLEGKDKAMLVDSGMNVKNIKEIVSSLTDREVFLVNTHADRDHIAGNGEFDSFYMNPSEYCSYFSSASNKGEPLPVFEGDVFDLGDRKISVIALPGHTPGSIALLDEKYRVLISGDPIQKNGRIFMFGTFRNMHAYRDSLVRLLKRADEFDEIWPSHAEIPVSKDILPSLIRSAEEIISGNAETEETEVHGMRISIFHGEMSDFLLNR